MRRGTYGDERYRDVKSLRGRQVGSPFRGVQLNAMEVRDMQGFLLIMFVVPV